MTRSVSERETPAAAPLGLDGVFARLRELADPERARLMQRYFKTGPGEYGEGDLFVGISMPKTRQLLREYGGLPLSQVVDLLHSPMHEARMLSLLILCRRYRRSEAGVKEEIYQLYLSNTRFINNWDLVDLSARDIVGAYLRERDRGELYRLAASPVIWERRIAIMATSDYIRLGEYADTLAIARLLLHDPEDLIHKAVGWMLREVGKRDRSVEEEFLREHYAAMPRTMLRYAIERFPEELRKKYLMKSKS